MKKIFAYNPTGKPFGLYNKTNESLDMVFSTYEEAKEELDNIELNEYDIGEYVIVLVAGR